MQRRTFISMCENELVTLCHNVTGYSVTDIASVRGILLA